MTYFRTPFVEALLVAVDGAGKGREVRGGEVMSVMIIPVIAKIRIRQRLYRFGRSRRR